MRSLLSHRSSPTTSPTNPTGSAQATLNSVRRVSSRYRRRRLSPLLLWYEGRERMLPSKQEGKWVARREDGGRGLSVMHQSFCTFIKTNPPTPTPNLLPLLMAAHTHCLRWDFVMIMQLKMTSSKPLHHHTHRLPHPSSTPPVRLQSLRAASLRCHCRLLVLTGIFRC